METEKIKKETQELIKGILEEGINTNNLQHLDKLVDIYKDSLKIECMEGEMNMYNNYGDYGRYDGRGPGHGSYGNYNDGYNDYGRRGYDMKYRGHDSLDRMYNDYGRYMESRERYGANEETDKSYHYMVKALEDFIKVLYEEANTEQQKQMLRETLQRSMM